MQAVSRDYFTVPTEKHMEKQMGNGTERVRLFVKEKV